MLTHGTLFAPQLDGMFLVEFDPEALDGMGTCSWTAYPEQAMKFDSAIDGFKLWGTQSRSRPLRDDDKPNRPLSAHTIEMIPFEEA